VVNPSVRGGKCKEAMGRVSGHKKVVGGLPRQRQKVMGGASRVVGSFGGGGGRQGGGIGKVVGGG